MSKGKILSLLGLLCVITSCNQNPNTNVDYYDYNWTRGEEHIDVQMPLTKNPQAQLSSLNKMRKTQNRLGISSLGDINLLVVPINFKNDINLENKYSKLGHDIYINYEDLNNIQEMYFGETTSSSYYSVKDYYKQSSYNKCNIDGVVSEVITLPETFDTYLRKVENVGLNEVFNEIVNYVYTYIFETTKSLYIGDFDSNDDKKVDAISIIVNYDYTFEYPSTDELSMLNYIIPYFLQCGNTFFNDNFKDSEFKPNVNSFSIISDQYRRVDFAERDSRAFINNVGLMLGLDNYLDTTGNMATGYVRATLGYKDMMQGMIGDHNPFSKYQLGWVKPQIYSKEILTSEGIDVTINPKDSDKSTILLHSGTHNEFSEYLMLDLYTPSGLNVKDILNEYIYNNKTFSTSGVRLYKVDSRLIRGIDGKIAPYYGNATFEEEVVLSNGKTAKYEYDYAYTNNGVNDYINSGINQNFPLVSFLSKDGINRHLVSSSYKISDDNMFKVGDSFGENSEVDGFYKNFRFNGENGVNGDKLNITFTVKSIENGVANITLKGVN